MAQRLITGMSGVGKTTVLGELSRRGYRTVDTDYDGWVLPNGTWDEPRLSALLASESSVAISGTVENQGLFYDRFDAVVLLSAPVEVLLQRVTTRTNNPYGISEADQSQIRQHVLEVEPLLRAGATHEFDGLTPVAELADQLEQLIDASNRTDPAVKAVLGEDVGGDEEQPLMGGLTTESVTRVGDTVRRSRGWAAERAAAVLSILERLRYPYSPRYLGVDEKGRDILSFVPGSTTDHPEQRDEASYAAGAVMLRELHTLTIGSVVQGEQGTIIHGDAGPFNTIFRDGMPVCFIDWDSARIGEPLDDLAYMAWTWCVQSLGRVPIEVQAEHVRLIRDGYGLAHEIDLVAAMMDQQARVIEISTEQLARTDREKRFYEGQQRALDWATADRDLLAAHASTFNAALATARHSR